MATTISRSRGKWLLFLLSVFLPHGTLSVDEAIAEPYKEPGGGGSGSGSSGSAYSPIKKVDSTAYIGVWYQAYASASVIYTFELGGNCVTATYSATSKNRTIQVLNEIRPWGEGDEKDKDEHRKEEDHWWDFGLFDGPVTLKVRGYLTQSPEVDGQGDVELQPGPLPLCLGCPNINDVNYTAPGNYWIMMLGPKRDGKYQYSVVTNGDSKTQCYVLTRNVTEFEYTWKNEVMLQLQDWGFTSATNRPRQTNQENCGYTFYTEDDTEDEYHDDKYPNDKYNDEP